MADDKLSRPRKEADQLASLAGPIGEIVGVRSMCRGCGRNIMSPPIGGVKTFCCVTCWEGYPENYIRLTSDRILAEIAMSAKRMPKEGTRAAFEELAIDILRTSHRIVINVTSDGGMPWHILTLKGAQGSRYFKDRVEPDGPAPEAALFGAERVYAMTGISAQQLVMPREEGVTMKTKALPTGDDGNVLPKLGVDPACIAAHAQIVKWLKGTLDDEEGEKLASHLLECESCREARETLARAKIEIPRAESKNDGDSDR